MLHNRTARIKLEPLSVEFYDRNTLDVTLELLGKYLVRRNEKRKWIGRIVEAEAYIGEEDPACHAFRGLTPRTRVMYGPAGHAYVYFTYGMHFMLNVVTERKGFPAAVLLRALEPVFGFDTDDPRPASGPGKLCRSMRIDKTLNGVSLCGGQLWIGNGKEAQPAEIRWSQRIGVTDGADRIWRAYVLDNAYVSRKSNLQDCKTPDPYKKAARRSR